MLLFQNSKEAAVPHEFVVPQLLFNIERARASFPHVFVFGSHWGCSRSAYEKLLKRQADLGNRRSVQSDLPVGQSGTAGHRLFQRADVSESHAVTSASAAETKK